MTKTGARGRPWVVIDSAHKPLPVRDVEDYWSNPPPTLSDRCAWWLEQIERGWRPNRRIAGEGYYGAAEWYGIWIWELWNVIYPAVRDD